MKSRIIRTPETEPAVYCYNADEAEALLLEKAAADAGFTLKHIDINHAGETVAFITGESTAASWTDMTDSRKCLIFCGTDSSSLDRILAAMKKQGVSFPLKAVVTQYNRKYTLSTLLDELEKEYSSFANKKQK